MLNGDRLVRHNICPVKGANDMAGYIQKSFGYPITTAVEALLVLAAYSLYITHEEIYGTFPMKSTYVSDYVIPFLLDKEYLVKIPFSGPLGVSRTCFRITAEGFGRANECCGGMLPNNFDDSCNTRTAFL